MYKLPRPNLADLLQALSLEQHHLLLHSELRRRAQASLPPLKPGSRRPPALLSPLQAKG